MGVTLIRLVVLLAIGALVTLGRFGFPRSSRVRFLGILVIVVELVDLVRESVKSFASEGEVRETRKLKEMTAHIDKSKRILRLEVVNDIVHGRRKRHKKMACFSFIGPSVLQEMAIG